jgi:hypothetical protein
MNLALEAIPVPLRDDGHGGLRVGQTRVSLVWSPTGRREAEALINGKAAKP